MSLTLYHGEPNGPSLTVLAALYESKREAELVAIDLAAGERHARAPQARLVEMSIEGEGPVLVADGEPMADSVFIAQYLDESGGGSLQPTDAFARWEMEMWCRFIIERVAPAAAFLGNRAHLTPKLQAMGDGDFGALVGRIGSADLADRWRKERLGDYPETRSARTAERRSARPSRSWRRGWRATGSSAPSPSPTSRPMPGSRAWLRSCPRPSPAHRRPGPGWSA